MNLKLKFSRLSFILLILVLSNTSFSQSVGTAKIELSNNNLVEAKTEIDGAFENEKTKSKSSSWKTRGDIYLAIAESQIGNTAVDAEAAIKAAESYQKAIELDTKGKLKAKLVKNFDRVKYTLSASGGDSFNNKDFKSALKNYETSIKIAEMNAEIDTISYFNSTLCLRNLSMNKEAIPFYEKCIELGYQTGSSFEGLIYVLSELGDEELLVEKLKTAREKYPENYDFLIEEVNYHLKKGNFEDAERTLTQAINMRQGDAQLRYIIGTVYSDMSNEKDGNGNKPENFDELKTKSEEAFKKTIELKSDHILAHYQLGVLYFNTGATVNNEANELDDDSKYDELIAESKGYFEKALPLLEKARELSDSKDILHALMQVYARLNFKDKYEATKALYEN